MKILHTISTIDKPSGGPSTYLQMLANEILKYSDVSIVTKYRKNSLTFNPKIKLVVLKRFLINGYSAINKIDTDIYHGNGLWQFPVHLMVLSAKAKRKPYVISPHGMLESWALKKGKLKKSIALWAFQRKDIENAAAIHATSIMEAESIRSLGFRNPIAIIPNGIDPSEFQLPDTVSPPRKKTLLFLSRIHPKKGIEILISAWQNIDKILRREWQVEIAGDGGDRYLFALKKLIIQQGLTSEIRIIGPQYGISRIETYHRADLFVLPSYSENFGMVVAEALASGVPVITTKGTPWEELNSRNAGWWIDIGLEPLVKTLQEAMSLSQSERHVMGQNGRKLIEENYSIEMVANKMIQLYEWILNGGQKPEFVNIWNNN